MDGISPGIGWRVVPINGGAPLLTVLDPQDLPLACADMPMHDITIYNPAGECVWVEGDGGLLDHPYRWAFQLAAHQLYPGPRGLDYPDAARRWACDRALTPHSRLLELYGHPAAAVRPPEPADLQGMAWDVVISLLWLWRLTASEIAEVIRTTAADVEQAANTATPGSFLEPEQVTIVARIAALQEGLDSGDPNADYFPWLDWVGGGQGTPLIGATPRTVIVTYRALECDDSWIDLLALTRSWTWSGPFPSWSSWLPSYEPPVRGEAVRACFWWGLDSASTRHFTEDPAACELIVQILVALRSVYPPPICWEWMTADNDMEVYGGLSPIDHAFENGSTASLSATLALLRGATSL